MLITFGSISLNILDTKGEPCRAIVNEPALLFADEPTGNLDQSTTSKVMRFLLELIKEHNISAIIASHNPMISELVDKNAKIADGKIVYN